MSIASWFIILFGVISIISGVRAIRKRYVNTDVDEYRGTSAVRWGVLWIVLGSLFILGAVFDIQWLRAAINFYFSS